MTYIQLKAVISPKEPAADILIAELGEIGFESFEDTKIGFLAWIQEPLFNLAAINAIELLHSDDFNIELTYETIAPQNWNAEWEKNFAAIELNEQAVIKAVFHQLPKTYQYEFIISPKMAFGTGHHETTWLMANVLFEQNVKDKVVLDMGCGTGILAIVAEKLGASQLMAIDIEAPAIENTHEHIQLNACSKIEVKLGGAEQLSNQQYDIILANINRNVLLNDMKHYTAVLKQGGTIHFSGFFGTDIETIQEEATKNGLSYVSEALKNNWARLSFTKP